MLWTNRYAYLMRKHEKRAAYWMCLYGSLVYRASIDAQLDVVWLS